MSRWKLWLAGAVCIIIVAAIIHYSRMPEVVSWQETIFKRSFTFDDSIVKELNLKINGQAAFEETVVLEDGTNLDVEGELELTPESGLMQGGDGAEKPISAVLVCRPPGSDEWETVELQSRDINVAIRPTGKKGVAYMISKGLKAPPVGEYEMRLIVNFGKHALAELTSYWLATGKLSIRPAVAGAAGENAGAVGAQATQ